MTWWWWWWWCWWWWWRWWIVYVVWLIGEWSLAFFQPGPLSEILNMLNLRHAMTRIWTCADQLCSSVNHLQSFNILNYKLIIKHWMSKIISYVSLMLDESCLVNFLFSQQYLKWSCAMHFIYAEKRFMRELFFFKKWAIFRWNLTPITKKI